MKKIKRVILLLFVYSLVISTIHYFRIGNDYYDLITTIINVITGLIPIYFGYLALRYFGLKTLQGKSILFITLTMFLWLLGDIIWVIVKEVVVSVADIVWLVGYPLFGLGVFYGIKVAYPDYFSEKKKMIILSLILVVLIIVYFKFFPLSWDNEISIVENIVTFGYIFADLLLVIFIVLLISLVFSGVYSQGWIVIGIGALMWWIGDIYYAINYETYVGGDLIDLVWYFGFLFYALGLILLKHNAEKITNGIKKKTQRNKK
jgi:hypothetical protein